MSTPDDTTSASRDSTPPEAVLLAQLKELNERSRTYGRQLWQVPFAYFIGSTVALAQLAERKPGATVFALFAIAGFGVFTTWHLVSLLGAAKRSFDGLQSIEKRLNLCDAQWTPGHLYALLCLTIATAGAALLMAVYLVGLSRPVVEE